MSIVKRIKNLWALSNIDLQASQKTQTQAIKMINDFVHDTFSRKRMATIIDTHKVELFPTPDGANEEENDRDTN